MRPGATLNNSASSPRQPRPSHDATTVVPPDRCTEFISFPNIVGAVDYIPISAWLDDNCSRSPVGSVIQFLPPRMRGLQSLKLWRLAHLPCWCHHRASRQGSRCSGRPFTRSAGFKKAGALVSSWGWRRATALAAHPSRACIAMQCKSRRSDRQAPRPLCRDAVRSR